MAQAGERRAEGCEMNLETWAGAGPRATAQVGALRWHSLWEARERPLASSAGCCHSLRLSVDAHQGSRKCRWGREVRAAGKGTWGHLRGLGLAGWTREARGPQEARRRWMAQSAMPAWPGAPEGQAPAPSSPFSPDGHCRAGWHQPPDGSSSAPSRKESLPSKTSGRAGHDWEDPVSTGAGGMHGPVCRVGSAARQLCGLVQAASRTSSPPLQVWAAILLPPPEGLYAQCCRSVRHAVGV